MHLGVGSAQAQRSLDSLPPSPAKATRGHPDNERGGEVNNAPLKNDEEKEKKSRWSLVRT